MAGRNNASPPLLSPADGTVHVLDLRMPEQQPPRQQVGRFRGLPRPVTDLHWQPSPRASTSPSGAPSGLRAAAATGGHAAHAPNQPPGTAFAAALDASSSPGSSVSAASGPGRVLQDSTNLPVQARDKPQGKDADAPPKQPPSSLPQAMAGIELGAPVAPEPMSQDAALSTQAYASRGTENAVSKVGSGTAAGVLLRQAHQ